jgi:hypothetical protein
MINGTALKKASKSMRFAILSRDDLESGVCRGPEMAAILVSGIPGYSRRICVSREVRALMLFLLQAVDNTSLRILYTTVLRH